MSILSHIELAAGKAGVSVTVHDASKPVHLKLPHSVLVSRARKLQAGHSSALKGCSALIDVDGGPAAAHMVRHIYVAYSAMFKRTTRT